MVALEIDTRQLVAEYSQEVPVGFAMDESLDVIASFRFQNQDRFGGGTPYPAIPESQRAYDGDNLFEYCESWR